MKTLTGLIIAITLLACDDATEEPVPAKGRNEARSGPDGPAGCYIKVTGRDSVILRLEFADSMLSGQMVFDNYEKDGSHGAVKGIVQADIIKMWYDFEAEGMRSVMQIWFKKSGESLIRGIGDMSVSRDSTFYKDPASVSWPHSENFQPVGCETVRDKLNKWFRKPVH